MEKFSSRAAVPVLAALAACATPQKAERLSDQIAVNQETAHKAGLTTIKDHGDKCDAAYSALVKNEGADPAQEVMMCSLSIMDMLDAVMELDTAINKVEKAMDGSLTAMTVTGDEGTCSTIQKRVGLTVSGLVAALSADIENAEDGVPMLGDLAEWRAKINEGWARIENVTTKIGRFDCSGGATNKKSPPIIR